MQSSRTVVFVVLAAVTALLLPRGLSAQGEVQIDFRGGLAVPVGDLGNFVDPSPGFTIGVNVPLVEHVSLRFDGGADIYGGGDIDGSVVGEDVDGPDLTLTRFTAGAIAHLVRPEDSPFLVDANLGGGVGILTSNRTEFSIPNGGVAIVDLGEAYFTGAGGVLLGYVISDQVDVFVSGQAFLTLADDEDTQSMGFLTTEGAPETLWSFPFSVGLKFNFPR